MWGYQRQYAPDREEYVLREGRCPKCRTQILDPGELVPLQAPSVPRLRTVVGMLVLIGLLLVLLTATFRTWFR